LVQLTLQDMKTLSELMDHVLDLDGAERTRWLAELATGPHAPLQPFLADMLARQADMTTAFLVRPIALPGGASDAPGRLDAAAFRLDAGARVGPYLLLREIGQGGMGAVWLADRVDGALKRQVALKLPTIHLTAALAERFARERDILAQLSHPNIARLYDAGVADNGRPYLALEYVEGKPITEHCDALRLPVAERLRRFLQVAAAVQYAHANLVIHRDLKPSNILVSDDGQVHLLDFGIAKLLADPTAQAHETELTMLAGRALTLDYASPEQIGGGAISTASDVYSMGVVLYQLLTGQKPYALKRGTRGELEEAILSADAVRMSDSVRRGDETTALRTGLSKERLARALAGDLDTIVDKAMRQDPLQRYGTVAALAEDIARHLDGQPVDARPQSWRYRAGKFVSRNRLGVAAASAVAVALAAGLGTALWQASVAREQARRADAEARAAKRETVRGDAVQGYLLDLFSANSQDQKNAVEIGKLTARQLLDRGAGKLESSASLPDDVNAVLFRLFGELYENLDELDRSIALHQRGAAAAAAAHGKASRQYALALLELAWVRELRTPGQPPMDLVEDAKAILARVAPNGEEYAQALYFEAEFVARSNPARSVAAAQESIRLMDAAGGSNRRKAFAQRALGYAQRALGNVDEATVAFEHAAVSFAQLYGADGFEVGITKGDQCQALRQLLRLSDAERVGRESVEILRAYRGERAAWEGYGQRLARVMAERGRVVEAEKLIRTGYDRLQAANPAPSDMKSQMANELADMALAQGEVGRAHELLARHQEAVPNGYPTIYAGVLIRSARVALERAALGDARRFADAARAIERQKGLPYDFARDVALVAAEVAAAEGKVEQAVTELGEFQAKFPLARAAPLAQLTLDLGTARVYAAGERWPEVQSVLKTWLGRTLRPGEEIPLPLKAELLLLAGEAGLHTRATGTGEWLRDANTILERSHAPGSSRLLRAKRALARQQSAAAGHHFQRSSVAVLPATISISARSSTRIAPSVVFGTVTDAVKG